MADGSRRGLKFLPKNATRRSEADRQAFERAETERRTTAAAATAERETPAATRGSRGSSRGGATARGRSSAASVAGPLAGPSTAYAGSASAASGSSAVRVKSEHSGGEASSPERSKKKGPAKKAKQAEARQEVEDDDAQPRDIDDAASSAADSGSDSEGRKAAAAQRKLHRRLKPVRSHRAAHVERAVGINTEASSAAAATIRQEREGDDPDRDDPDDEQERAEHEARQAGRDRLLSLLAGAAPRDGRVFLFQLPAFVPDLVSSPALPQRARPKKAAPRPKAPAKRKTKAAEPLSVHGDGSGSDAEAPPPGPVPGAVRRGRVGSLRVWHDGRAVLDWGGVPLALAMGSGADLPQEVALADRADDPDAMQGVEGNAAKRWAHARADVAGKFVASFDF